mgnify:CR=1 FL=1
MIWAFLAGFVAVLMGVFLLRPRVARLFAVAMQVTLGVVVDDAHLEQFTFLFE